MDRRQQRSEIVDNENGGMWDRDKETRQSNSNAAYDGVWSGQGDIVTMDVDHEVGEEMGVHAVDSETLVDYHLELDGQLPFSSHVHTSSIY